MSYVDDVQGKSVYREAVLHFVVKRTQKRTESRLLEKPRLKLW